MINNLFFELIQVSLGTRICLSHTPSADEWGKLYDMTKKQSLVGVCFAGVQWLVEQGQKPPEMLYLTWMGMAAKIQQRNEDVNRQCVALQKRLSAEGIASRVLKGQGVAQAYLEQLRGLRQSGDIDLWMIEPKEKVVAWAEKVGMTEEPGYLHVGARCFQDTEVELHYRPTYCRCLWYNKRLQEFCEKHKNDYEERGGIVVPSWEFDVVYQLSHIYRHLFGLGIGLRQLMDYYFVLRADKTKTLKTPEGSASACTSENLSNGSTSSLQLFNSSATQTSAGGNAADNNPSGKKQKYFDNLRNRHTSILDTLKHLGHYDFAGAVMFVMREVFCLEEQYMICPVDEKRGRMLLRLVMQTGNFGHQDEKQKEARDSTFGTINYKMNQWWKLVRFYPEETLSAPLWSLIRKFD